MINVKQYSAMKILKEIYSTKDNVVDKLTTLITTALGLVAALAWNNAIQTIFKQIFGTKESIWAMVSYAVVVTVIAVVCTIWIGKIKPKEIK